MKRFLKTLLITSSLALVAYLGYTPNKQLHDLAFSNVEALASGETGSMLCMGTGSVYCNGRYYNIKIDNYSLE